MRLLRVPTPILSSAFVLASSVAQASGVLIGPLWMEGVTIREYPKNFVDDSEGRWIRAEFSASPQARLIVFKAPVAVTGFPTTESVLAKAKAEGIGVVINGQLDWLRLSARTYHSSEGNRLWIAPGKLSAHLGRVTSGLQQIAGGSIDLAGGKLYVTNVTEFKTQGDGLQGIFELESWGRTLVDAHIELAASTTAVATLTHDPRKNVVLRVNMASAHATLWHAALSAKQVSFGGEALELARSTLGGVELVAATLRVSVQKGAVSATIAGVSGRASSLQLKAGAHTFEAADSRVSWSNGTATGEHTNAALRLRALDVTGAALSSANSRLDHQSARLLSGAMEAANVAISQSSLKGSFVWAKPTFEALDFIFPSGSVAGVSLNLDGRWEQPFTVSGSVESTAFRIGGVAFDQPLRLAFPRTVTNVELIVPIVIDVPAASGSLRLVDSEKTVMLSASLKRLAMRGSFRFSFAAPANSRLEVPPRQLNVAFAAGVSSTPWLGSTTPLFAGAALTATNHNIITATAKQQTGLIVIDTDALALGDPVIKVGKSKPFRARMTLSATAGATIGYCMDRGTLALARASLRAIDARLQSLETGGTMDVGGTLIVDPDGSITDLVVAVDRLKGSGTFSSARVELAGSRVYRPHDPERPNDISFSGALANPLSIGRLDGVTRFSGDSIEITNLRASGMRVGISGASIDISQAISLNTATVSFGGDEIISSVESPETDSDQPKPITGTALASLEEICLPPQPSESLPTKTREYFQNVSIQASGALRLDGDVGGDVSVHLASAPTLSADLTRLSGRSDRLDGSGGGTFSGFAGTAKSAIMTTADCEGGKLLRIPTDTHVATGGTALKIDLIRGKAVARGTLAGFAMEMNSTGRAECHGPWQKHVVVAKQEGWTEGICPTWSEPLRRCRWTWETPEVSYEFRTKAVIRALTATVLMTNPYFESAEKKAFLCNVGAAGLGPVIVIGGYYPEFRGSIPIVSDIANALVGVVAETVESAIATFLATGIAGLATTFLNLNEVQVACMLMGATK